MSSASARPSPWRSALFFGALASAAAWLLYELPAAKQRGGAIAGLIDSIRDLALVVPGSASGIAPFFVERCEVTNERYAAFVAATGYAPEHGTDFLTELRAGGGIEVGEENARRPVAFVSASDAEAYARWRGGRLPTHAEWTELLGASAQSPYEPRGVFSRYRHNLLETGLDRTANVGTFESGKTLRRSLVVAPPVYDLIGNVAEWVRSAESVGAAHAALGGSFRDSTDRAFDRFFGEFTAPDRRSDAVGFRCVVPDATGFARSLLSALAECDDATFQRTVAALRPHRFPLERLIESIRVEDAGAGETPLDPPFAIRDVLYDLGDGRLLRFLRARDATWPALASGANWIAETIDGERGGVASVEIGAFRGEPYLELGRERDRVLLASQDPERAESGSRLFLAIDGERAAILDVVTRSVLEAFPELPVVRVPGFAHRLPSCVLSEPTRLAFAPCPGTASGMVILELTIRGDELSVRRVARVTAAEDLHASAEDDRIFALGTIGLGWPDFDPNCIELPGVVAAAYAMRGDAVAPRAALLPETDVPSRRPDARSDRLFVFLADGTIGIVDGLAAGGPRFSRAAHAAEATFRFTASLAVRDGVVVEATDRRQERLVLVAVDRTGRARAAREIENLGTRRTRAAKLANGVILFFDSQGAIHRLDDRLRSVWVTTGRVYAPDLAAPALVDFDRDGDAELVVGATQESLARLDLGTGEELDRWSLDDRTVLAIASTPRAASDYGVALAVNDHGVLRMRAISTRVDAVARRLIRALRDDPEAGSEP